MTKRLPAAIAAGAAASGIALLLWFLNRNGGATPVSEGAQRREDLVYLGVGILAATGLFVAVLRGFWSRERFGITVHGAGAAVAAVAALVAGLIAMWWLPRRGILTGRKVRPFMATCATLFLFLDYMLIRDFLTRRAPRS